MINNPITDFQKIEDELNYAYEQNDLNRIGEMLSEKWYMVESATGLSSRDEFLSALESGTLVQRKMMKQVKKVTLVDNIAVVLSRGKNEGVYNSISYGAEQWVTNIFEKEGESWRCVMTQETPANDCPD